MNMLETEPTLEVGQVWEGYNGSTFTIKGKGVTEWLVERKHSHTNSYTENLAEVSFRNLLEFYDAKLVSKPKASLCTCGAAKCGHSGHSGWCDSLVTSTSQVAEQIRKDLANTPTYTIKYSVNGSIANSLPSQFPASFDPQISVSSNWQSLVTTIQEEVGGGFVCLKTIINYTNEGCEELVKGLIKWD